MGQPRQEGLYISLERNSDFENPPPRPRLSFPSHLCLRLYFSLYTIYTLNDMFLETLEELFPNGTSIDGWPSSPPSRAPSPLPDVIEEEVASPTDFTHDSEEDPATPPLLGLGLPTGDDEETDDFHGISAITPRWRPFSLAPEPTSFVLRGDVGSSKREVIDGPAGPFTEKYSLQLESIKDDLVQRDIVIIEHLSVLHPEHKLPWEMQGEDESYQSSPESVIEFDTESDSDSDSDFMPSKPTITKRDEQTSDKENASTKKATGAGHKSNAVQSAPAPSVCDHSLSAMRTVC